MSTLSNHIADVSLIALAQIIDTRGAVLHMLRSDDPSFTRFGECYFSEVLPGVVKGWKRHTQQTQHLAVVNGRARFVLFDDRDGSVTKGVIQTLELGRPDAYMRLCIPPNIWYGFSCLSDAPALLVNCSDIPHSPEESHYRPLDDTFIPYCWQKT